MVSQSYLETLRHFDGVSVVGCSDKDRDRAEQRAREFSIPFVGSVDEVISHPDVEIVLNLTTPNAHFEIASAAIATGKSVYNEKPLAASVDGGRQLLASAAAAGVRVGAAPDSFFGSMHQTARELLDGGTLGEVVGASAAMVGHGHERWHPDAAFYYQRGGGPLFDFGPYCVTALVNLLGPVSRVHGVARRGARKRVQETGPRTGQAITVEGVNPRCGPSGVRLWGTSDPYDDLRSVGYSRPGPRDHGR